MTPHFNLLDKTSDLVAKITEHLPQDYQAFLSKELRGVVDAIIKCDMEVGK